MAVRVAINGFGRIGRLAFRQMFGAEGYEVVAINDLTSPKMLAHLLKYDSSQGKYALADTVSASDDSITVNGQTIKIYAFPDANNCPWGDLKVDVVLECSGFYTSKEKAQAHINAGARKVVISAPAGNDLPTIVYNVNHKTLTKEDNVVVVSVNTIDGIEYKAAYKTIDKEKMVEVYTDVNTGEVIKKIPFKYDVATNGSGHTVYNGIQPIICEYLNTNKYILQDGYRNIRTLNASSLNLSDIPNSLLDYESNSSEFSSSVYIKSVTISSLNSDCNSLILS